MYIPATFKIFDQTIKVVFSRTLIDRYEAFGIWEYRLNKITLQQSTRKNPLTKEQIHSTFIHECCHAFFDLSGYNKLSLDEKLVSTISNLMHQFIEQIHEN